MSWITRLRNALNPRRLDEDLEDEIRDHLERRTSYLQEQGLSRPEAQQRAGRIFGNVAGIREESRESPRHCRRSVRRAVAPPAGSAPAPGDRTSGARGGRESHPPNPHP